MAAKPSLTAAQKEEARLVKKFPKVFTRAAGKLTLAMENGKAPRVFTDNTNTQDSEGYLEHHLFSYHPSHHVAVVERLEGEGGDFVFVSLKTGQELTVQEPPKWNRAGDFFASANLSELADNKHGLEIGHCDGKECKLIEVRDGLYHELKWNGALSFRVTNRVPSADGGEGLVLKVRCTMNRKNNTASCVP